MIVYGLACNFQIKLFCVSGATGIHGMKRLSGKSQNTELINDSDKNLLVLEKLKNAPHHFSHISQHAALDAFKAMIIFGGKYYGELSKSNNQSPNKAK